MPQLELVLQGRREKVELSPATPNGDGLTGWRRKGHVRTRSPANRESQSPALSQKTRQRRGTLAACFLFEKIGREGEIGRQKRRDVSCAFAPAAPRIKKRRCGPC